MNRLLKKQLKILHEKEEKGEAEVWYYDESGFSMTPYIPYAWQEKGKTLTIDSFYENSENRSKKNIL